MGSDIITEQGEVYVRAKWVTDYKSHLFWSVPKLESHSWESTSTFSQQLSLNTMQTKGKLQQDGLKSANPYHFQDLYVNVPLT